MRNLLIAATLTAGLALGGCAGTGGTGKPADVAAKIKEVQDYTRLACKFVPTVATLTAIFSRAIGDSISTIGGAICTAVDVAPLADGPGQGGARAYGVVLRGKRV